MSLPPINDPNTSGTSSDVPVVNIIQPPVGYHGYPGYGIQPEVQQVEVDTNRPLDLITTSQQSWLQRVAIPQSIADLIGDASLHLSFMILAADVIRYAPMPFKLTTVGVLLLLRYVGGYQIRQDPRVAKTSVYRRVLSVLGVILGFTLVLGRYVVDSGLERKVLEYLPTTEQEHERPYQPDAL